MKKRFVISSVPVRLPFQSTILYTFLMYYFKVSGIWWGVFITLYSIFWIIAIIMKLSEEPIDLNESSKDESKEPAKSSFKDRLIAMKNRTA